MKKYCKAVVNIGVALVVLLLILFLAPRMLSFFMPFVVGWIIALIAAPMVGFFEDKVKLKRKAGTVFVIVAVIGLVVFLLYLLGTALLGQILGMINSLPAIWAGLEQDFANLSDTCSVMFTRLPENVQTTIMGALDNLGNVIGSVVGKISQPTINAVGNFAMQLPSMIIALIMALLSAYFFVADRSAIYEWLGKKTPKSMQANFKLLKNSLARAVGGYVKAQLKIEVWMYLLLVIGLSILQVDYVLAVALGIAFLDFFPFFGTGTVMVPWAIIEILNKDYRMAVGLLIIWAVGQLARQIIQPKIVGDSVGVPPIPTLFLLYIGYKFSGVIGMIVAVPIGLILFTMYDEGVFDTTKNSILILAAGINKFRKLDADDMSEVEEMRARECNQTGESGQTCECEQEDVHA